MVVAVGGRWWPFVAVVAVAAAAVAAAVAAVARSERTWDLGQPNWSMKLGITRWNVRPL